MTDLDRDFVAHLTLIRMRRPLRIGPLPATEPMEVTFDPPALYQSETRPEGAVYRKI